MSGSSSTFLLMLSRCVAELLELAGMGLRTPFQNLRAWGSRGGREGFPFWEFPLRIEAHRGGGHGQPSMCFLELVGGYVLARIERCMA